MFQEQLIQVTILLSGDGALVVEEQKYIAINLVTPTFQPGQLKRSQTLLHRHILFLMAATGSMSGKEMRPATGHSLVVLKLL